MKVCDITVRKIKELKMSINNKYATTLSKDTISAIFTSINRV